MIKVKNVQSLYASLYEAVNFCTAYKNEKVEVIVPDKLSLFMEKFLFEHMNITASFNLKVSTLNRFAKKNCFVEKEKQISKIGSILLIHKILNENIDKFSIFSSKAYSFSYAENILRTINQLKASKITFEEMFKFSSNDEQLNKKIADLSLIYELYEQSKAGLLDASDIFLMSAFNVTEGRKENKILFVGFDDFTAIEYSIIERLALDCEVNIFNYMSKAGNKHIYNSEVFDQLKKIAYINEISFEVEDCVTQVSELKRFLQENLFAIKNESFCLNNDLVKIISARDVLGEIEAVARDIRLKILNGESYNNFGVAVYNLENHINIVKEIFAKYEINYYLDSEISINKSIFYKFLVSLLKYNLEGYSLTNLIDLINSPFFDISNEEKLTLSNKLINVDFCGIIKDDFVLKDIDENLLTTFKNFAKYITLNNVVSANEFIVFIKNMVENLNVREIISNIANEEVNPQNKLVLTKSIDIIYSLFDDIVFCDSDLDIPSFYDIFLHIPSVLKINNLPLTLDAVKVVDANNTMEIFDDLYIVNCTAENAPNLKYDCGIILDTEIEKLNFANKLNPTISHINKLSRLRLFNSVTMFEKELTITYSKNASDVVKELLDKLYVNINNNKVKLIPFQALDFGRYQAMSKMDYFSFICKNDKENTNLLKNYVKNKNFSQILKKRLNIYDNFNTISASTLENYFKCPFYMFLNNVLKIKAREESEIQSYDIGNMLHEIMYLYYKKNKNVGDIYEFCKKQVFKYVEKDDRLKLALNSPILINLIDEAVRVINGVDYLDKNSKFVPINFEYSFADNTAIKLKNIDIIGKVDRIDKSGDMLRIIDYKSGRAEAGLKELFYGYKLQLFLYSKAIENEMKKKVVGGFYLPLHNKFSSEDKNSYSLRGYFINEDFVIDSMDKNLIANRKSDIIDVKLKTDNKAYSMPENNEMENLKNYSLRVSEKAVDEIRSGYIKPSPLDLGDPCKYCAYSQICLRSCNGIQHRVVKSVVFDSFKEVCDE